MTDPVTTTGADYARAVGQRLRALREARGLSMSDVERASVGRFQRNTLGSYERGDRALSIAHLAELAEFYKVDVVELLPRPASEVAPAAVLDLDRVTRMPAGPLRAFVRVGRRRRGVRQGSLHYRRPMELTAADVQELGVLYGVSAEAMLARLAGWGVLVSNGAEPIASPVSERVK